MKSDLLSEHIAYYISININETNFKTRQLAMYLGCVLGFNKKTSGCN